MGWLPDLRHYTGETQSQLDTDAVQPVHRLALHSSHIHPSPDRFNPQLLPIKGGNRFSANLHPPSDRWGQTLALQHEALEAQPCLLAGSKLKLPLATDRTL